MACLTVGMWLCGVMFDEDCVSEAESSVDLKECVEYSTSTDSGCNDAGCAVALGMAVAIELPVTECHLYATYTAS